MLNRRQFIKNSALVSLAPTVPAFLARTIHASDPSDNGRILVVIQLDGGNDGINTVVPFRDEGYAKHRRELRLRAADLIKLTDDLAFHPRLRSASELFQQGRLSVVQGVGYPNPNRSHFESMAIWHSASTAKEERELGNGWLGDAISLRDLTPGPHAIHVGEGDLPLALRGRRCTATSLSSPADLNLTLSDLAAAKLDFAGAGNELQDFLTTSVARAYATAEDLVDSTNAVAIGRYPGGPLAQRLKLVSQMIKSNARARVYYTSQAGYDTHATQLATHGELLGDLSSGLQAFLDDMKESRLEDRILVMAFSEFGRRVAENASLGTDHGTAGPMLLAGDHVRQGFLGQTPSLTDLEAGDLKHSTDFRDVYAAVLEDWLHMPLPSTLSSRSELRILEA